MKFNPYKIRLNIKVRKLGDGRSGGRDSGNGVQNEKTMRNEMTDFTYFAKRVTKVIFVLFGKASLSRSVKRATVSFIQLLHYIIECWRNTPGYVFHKSAFIQLYLQSQRNNME